jgi:hypothetical protein
MSKPNEENLGLDWLEKMVERSKSEPVFEGTEWDRVLSEQGRITVFFEMLDLNLRLLLVTLEFPHDLAVHTSRYAGKQVSEIIKRCDKALKNWRPPTKEKSQSMQNCSRIAISD